MAQNTSHAVMQQRHEAHDSLDDFPTPPWATRALVEHVLWPMKGAAELKRETVWEPACNRGFMARALRPYFADLIATDIHHYGWDGQEETFDFLFADRGDVRKPDWIITNPPFRLAERFVRKAFDFGPLSVAVLVRTSFLEGVGRYRDLYARHPPSVIAQFTERVPMVKGRFDPDASTATSYAWIVWSPRTSGTAFKWIPPCRRQLQRPDDA